MKKIVVFLLIAIIAISSLHKGLLVGYYLLNKNYIAANFCENINKPALKCDGKCYLRKQINATEQKSSNQKQEKLPDYLQNLKSVFLYFQQPAQLVNFYQFEQFILPEFTALAYLSFSHQLSSNGFRKATIKPPAFA